MDARNRFFEAIGTATMRVLRPLVRVLLRQGVSFNEFVELAKRVYVDVSLNEFAIPGRKPTISRASVLSGLTRKEVQRVLQLDAAPAPEWHEQYNRAARVIAGWVRDADFRDAAGEPLVLGLDDGPASFAELVRRYSGDMPARAMLDELLRVGVVAHADDGSIRLVTRAYVPRSSDVDKLAILGTDVADLLYTIDHNLQHGATDPRYQRKVMYDNLPVEALPEFREQSAARAQALLETLDRALSQKDRDVNPSINGSGRVRAGIGIYYFEQRLDKRPQED